MFVCHSEGERARNEYLSAFLNGVCQELQRCWSFHAEQFPVCFKNGPPPKGQPANLTQLWEALESTWTCIPVELFRHLVESMPQQTEDVLTAKGGATQY